MLGILALAKNLWRNKCMRRRNAGPRPTVSITRRPIALKIAFVLFLQILYTYFGGSSWTPPLTISRNLAMVVKRQERMEIMWMSEKTSKAETTNAENGGHDIGTTLAQQIAVDSDIESNSWCIWCGLAWWICGVGFVLRRPAIAYFARARSK